MRQLVRRLETFPAPVIAMIEGGVWGGACEVVLACDIIIAAPNATFAVTPARLGVPYNISGLLTFRNAANLRLVKERLFTAKPFGVERAERLGLINHVVPGERLEAFTYELAHEITANAPLSIAVMKEQLRILAGAAPMSPEGSSASRACAGSSTTARTTWRALPPSRKSASRCSKGNRSAKRQRRLQSEHPTQLRDGESPVEPAISTAAADYA